MFAVLATCTDGTCALQPDESGISLTQPRSDLARSSVTPCGGCCGHTLCGAAACPAKLPLYRMQLVAATLTVNAHRCSGMVRVLPLCTGRVLQANRGGCTMPSCLRWAELRALLTPPAPYCTSVTFVTGPVGDAAEDGASAPETGPGRGEARAVVPHRRGAPHSRGARLLRHPRLQRRPRGSSGLCGSRPAAWSSSTARPRRCRPQDRS